MINASLSPPIQFDGALTLEAKVHTRIVALKLDPGCARLWDADHADNSLSGALHALDSYIKVASTAQS